MLTLPTRKVAHVVIDFGVRLAVIVMSSYFGCNMRDTILALILMQVIYNTHLINERYPKE